MTQKTIDNGKPETMGINCYVRCTSNKIDTAKDNVRSINLNFDIRVGDQLVGKGNNLNINNITPEGYENLCAAFGVEDIDENTPFYAELMTLLTQERRASWSTAMERKDKRIDKDQADVTRNPNLLTEKQEELISDWASKDKAMETKVVSFLKTNNIENIGLLNKDQAVKLITDMKALEDKKPKEEKGEPAEKPEKAEKKKKAKKE